MSSSACFLNELSKLEQLQKFAERELASFSDVLVDDIFIDLKVPDAV